MKAIEILENTPHLLVLRRKRNWLGVLLMSALPLLCAGFYLPRASAEPFVNVCFVMLLILLTLPLLAFGLEQVICVVDSEKQLVSFGHSTFGQWYGTREIRFDRVNAVAIVKQDGAEFGRSTGIQLELSNGARMGLFGFFHERQAAELAALIANRMGKVVVARNIP